jgi:O-antigen ligase
VKCFKSFGRVKVFSKRLFRGYRDEKDSSDPFDEASSLAIPQPKPTGVAKELPESLGWKSRLSIIAAQIADFIISIEPIWVMLAAPVVFYSVLTAGGDYAWFALGGAVVPFLLRRIRQGYFSRRTPLDFPLALFLVACFIGLAVSPDKILSLGVLQSCLACLLFYYSLANSRLCEQVTKWVLISGSLIALSFAIYIYLQVPEGCMGMPFTLGALLPFHPEPLSIPGHTNPGFAPSNNGVSIIVELLTVILVGIALFQSKLRFRVMAGIVALISLGALVFAPNRSTWLVMSLALLFLLVWKSRWWLASIPGWLYVIFWSLSSRYGLTPQQVWENWQTIYGRLPLWHNVWQVIAEHPFTGVGLGYLYSTGVIDSSIGHAHNAFLQLYSDVGALGVIALIWAIVIYGQLIIKTRRSSAKHPWYGLAVGALAAVLVLFIYSFSDVAHYAIIAMGEGSYFYALSALLWFVLGFATLTQRGLSET